MGLHGNELQKSLMNNCGIAAKPPRTTSTFLSPDGLELFYRHWQSEKEISRLVVVHGIGKHWGRYGNVVEALLPRGVSIWALDLRGHGKSQGKRGHVDSFDDYLSDLRAFVRTARNDSGPVFLLGHSMGGLIALAFCIEYPGLVNGLVVSSPALSLPAKVPLVKKLLGHALSRILRSLTLSSGLDITKLSHDHSVVRAYAGDPLVHDRVSVRWFTEVVKAMEWVNTRSEALHVPLLMQLAGDDGLADGQAAVAFFKRLKTPDKTLKVYEGLYHEIYNEKTPERNTPLQDLGNWMEKRLGG